MVGPGNIVSREIEPPLPAGTVKAHSCGVLADAALLTASQRRRLCRMTQMALIAARRSHIPDPAQRLAVVMGTGLGCLDEGAVFIEDVISREDRAPMPSRFPGSVHNSSAAQIAIDLGARAMNSTPTAGDVTFESALWQGLSQLATDEADVALVGAVDELNKYPLSIGKRWGFWTEQTLPGEGAMVARLSRADAATPRLAVLKIVRLGRWRQPFDAEAEADWITEAVDLANVEVVLSGAKGWAALEDKYAAVMAALSKRAGRNLPQQTYKQICGEFHSASAFGFFTAVELVRAGSRSVLLYTLSPRGAKALCCLEP